MVKSIKDKLLRDKKDAFNDQSIQLISKILDDDSIREIKGWNKKIELATKATEQLKDPRFILKQLRSIIGENTRSDLDVRNAESAYRELEWFFQQSSITVPKQEEFGDEIFDTLGLKEAWQETCQEAKEQSQSFGEEIKQIMDILEQRHQSMQEATVYTAVGKMLQKMVDSCLNIAQKGILNQDCTNKAHETHGFGSVTFKIDGEQLKLNFLPTFDSEVPIEMNVQEEQGKEVVLLLTIRSKAGRLQELAMKKTNQDTLNLPSSIEGTSSWDWDSVKKFLFGDEKGEGTSHAIANEVHVKLSPDPNETRIVQGYTVFNRNADVLTEIFGQYPNFAENFRVASLNLQSYFMNLLAELYQKIKGESGMLELKEITSMEEQFRDMELNGLQLSWLIDMLTQIRERKRLQEEIDSHRAKAKEAEQNAIKAELELAKLMKKPRLK